MPINYQSLTPWVHRGSHVLDLGCGDGSLMHDLAKHLNISGYGLEIDPSRISECVAKGVNVIEQNLDSGLGNFADNSFDTVIMTQALQAMRYPHLVLEEMLRVGKECVITFPNFGNWRARNYLMWRGRMPVTKQLKYQWYDTPNIHFCTVTDFEKLCSEMNIRILGKQFLAEQPIDRQLKRIWPNLFCETAIYHLSK